MSEPFLLKPSAKDYLWGGTRLNDEYEKNIPIQPLAETWECSVHPDGMSLVASGKDKGQTLAHVLKRHPEYLGTRIKGEKFPILIKLIDAKENLSIQVHPDDVYAFEHENGSSGKAEMWYILEAEPDAKLVYGFCHKLNQKMLRELTENGELENYLQYIPIRKDDMFFVKAGTVHAICKGALVAEIQQNSNLTYRLYDYNRSDKMGRKRTLNIEKALDVVNMNAAGEPRQPMRLIRYQRGGAIELLCRCKYFQVERLTLNTSRCRKMLCMTGRSDSFEVLLCTNGCATIFDYNKLVIPIFQGDCIFIPADSGQFFMHGKARFLKVDC